eukprot:scaffold10954_cov74-Cyclotella_meneghiniana.AAC.17
MAEGYSPPALEVDTTTEQQQQQQPQQPDENKTPQGGGGDLFAGLTVSPSKRTASLDSDEAPAAADIAADTNNNNANNNSEAEQEELKQPYDMSRSPTPILSNVSAEGIAAASAASSSPQHKNNNNNKASSSNKSFKKLSSIPHPDQTLRLLRKFHNKSCPYVPSYCGGSKSSSWFGWVFGSAAEAVGDGDVRMEVFRVFSQVVKPDNDDDGSSTNNNGGRNENDAVIESILGASKNDSPSKARQSLSAFVDVMTTWCRSSAELALLMEGNNNDVNNHNNNGSGDSSFEELLALAMDTASALVAHGCLDEVYFKEDDSINPNDDGDDDEDVAVGDSSSSPALLKKTVNVLAESVFIADLSSEAAELSAMKFLLTAGCRVSSCSSSSSSTNSNNSNKNHSNSSSGRTTTNNSPPEPMLRGTHLLQAIRVCYHVYLNTGSVPNKTTAKAALQQITTSVFVRLEKTIENGALEDRMSVGSENANAGEEDNVVVVVGKEKKSKASTAAAAFPTQDHRDAYLVLRSLCKLSMQTKQEGGGSGGGAVSSSANASSDNTAASNNNESSSTLTAPTTLSSAPSNEDDPAFESRILALELLLHLLRHSSAPSILRAGPEFNYAIRQYLCTSLLKNTTSVDTTIVELSLRLFVPLIRHFRSLLKNEIEAFVTNVFFVILDSKNSTIQHKLLVVTLFEEICSDPTTLAEIFLNYDCDLSAVDLFQRIVNALGRVARVGLTDTTGSGTASSLQYVAGAGALRAEKKRQDHRELRLAAMKALRQVLASLHSSIVTQVGGGGNSGDISVDEVSKKLKFANDGNNGDHSDAAADDLDDTNKTETAQDANAKKSLVEMYDSKKKRREEESQAAFKFNQKPMNGLTYAAECGHLDVDDPVDVARYLLLNKDVFEKAQIGEFLGREKEWKDGFALNVLRAYGDALDFKGMAFDEAIRYYLSGFRLPGEAQKIDRIMEVFAARYTEQNPTTFPTADAAFILAFSIIMLNTDLHNPAIKEDRKMTIQSFQRMNSGVCDGGDFPDEMLADIFERIKTNPISLKEDDDARESAGINSAGASSSALSTASDFFFGSHYVEQEKTREKDYQKEGDQIIRDTESMLKRRRKANKHGVGKAHGGKSLNTSFKRSASASIKFVGTADSGLKDEYVTPMFDVTWGPALAVFSTAIESANGTDGILAQIATDEEMDHAIDNATASIDVSLNGFQLAICIAGLCGNTTARDAYVRALYNFTLLGTGRLLADRHVQCVQFLLRLGKADGELMGSAWEHVFRAISEVSRLHQVWESMARSERRELKAKEKASRASENPALNDDDGDDSDSDIQLEEEMDKHMIDEANAQSVHESIPPSLVDSIFNRSSSLSRRSLKEFVYELCRVSRMEISGYGGHVGSDANDVDLSNEHYMQRHAHPTEKRGVSGNQPAIYSLQKLVEVTHFNMESRPRLIFADIWETISTHLTSTALHEEAAVAMYAVDSLRQLSMQFLSRDELGVFEFQRRFLAPLETIMARSTHSEVKELLLNSVEQIIQKYGFDDEGDVAAAEFNKKDRDHLGTLRSGWRSVLIVLGTSGLDKNDFIATQGFSLLQDQIKHCIASCSKMSANNASGSLLSEHFVDLVDALLLYVSGPRPDLSSKAIDNLLQLTDLLADGKVPLKSSARRKSHLASVGGGVVTSDDGSSNNELEFWWPLLLGLSQTMGDRRSEVRIKGLTTLLAIINKHFLTPSNGSEGGDDETSPTNGDMQTLQLIFRGVLIPALEYEEIDGNSTSGFAPELLPTKFVHYITLPPKPNADSSSKKDQWINTTFEHLIDGCISICIRSLETFGSDALIEEVLAMLNSCLLSDSGHLAVKGLRRLQQFVTTELNPKDVSDDTWATVSHMLVRVLSVRGLPLLSTPNVEGISEEKKEEVLQEHNESMNEFIREQQFFSNRRYIGCNGAMVIGSLLNNVTIVKSMGVRWQIFLISGLGQGIRDWERAAAIIDSKVGPTDGAEEP